jgi:Flp pilus assembly protein TadG
MTANFFAQLKRFRRDRRGNIAVIFAIACVPLISAVGCAVDYCRATQLHSKLQAAIDAASTVRVVENRLGARAQVRAFLQTPAVRETGFCCAARGSPL